MIKVSVFQGDGPFGQCVFPLLTSSQADRTFEKVASSVILPDVANYISNLRPRPDAQYVLVNALGASEYYSSNINGDAFPEAALIHCSDTWRGVPLFDAKVGKEWPYGFPTFYGAHPFLHHRNKNPDRAYGEVELATWNDHMKRVELVIRVDKDKCEKFGGTGIWDKLKMGQYVDVSMGSRVPFDCCSICLNWNEYRKAQATYDPKRHKHPGEAVLEYHKRLIKERGHGIRGLAITRKDYCDHAGKNMNKILADGRKIFVYNDYPRFFDISFVFIGADRTAKVMYKIASDSQVWSLPSVDVAEHLGYDEKLAYEVPQAAKGIRRIGQLLTGSHQRALAKAHDEFDTRKVVHALNKQRIAAGEREGNIHATMAAAVNHKKNLRNAADTEAATVSVARKGAGVLAGVGAVGTGVLAGGAYGVSRLIDAADAADEKENNKVAQALDYFRKEADLNKRAKLKRAEMEKHGPAFEASAVPVLTRCEPKMSNDMMDALCEHSLPSILGGMTSMGMLLRPREFQRIIIIKMGLRHKADQLDHDGVVFSKQERGSKPQMEEPPEGVLSLLRSLFGSRSALEPALGPRIEIVARHPPMGSEKRASSHSELLLNNIGSAYTGYREQVLDYWTNDNRSEFSKFASSCTERSRTYLKHAFWNETGVPT